MWVVLVLLSNGVSLKAGLPLPQISPGPHSSKNKPPFLWIDRLRQETHMENSSTLTRPLWAFCKPPHLTVNLKASSPERKDLFSVLLFLVSSWEQWSTLCQHAGVLCSVLFDKQLLQPSFPTFVKKAKLFCVQMFSCPPLPLSPPPHSSFSYLVLKEMWASVRLMVLIIFRFPFIHTDCACCSPLHAYVNHLLFFF